MSTDAILTLLVIALAVVGMVREYLSPDFLLLGALGVLVAVGVLDLQAALDGFANPTLVTIGGLFVIAAGLRETGALESAARLLLGSASRLRTAMLRLSATTAAASAFLGNTSIVAMGIPLLRSWAGRRAMSPAKLLMPLSFAAILGGICTLIGTSTNLVAHGLLETHGMGGLGFFELASVGIPVAFAGTAYLVLVAPGLLPERKEARTPEERARERIVELTLEPGSDLAGKSIVEAGLEDQPGHALIRLERSGAAPGAVAEERLQEGDRLTFAGDARALGALALRPGMRRVYRRTPVESVGAEAHEAVVREGSELIGESIKAVDFPSRFNAGVTGVLRGGAPVEKDIGDVILRGGDTLLLSTGPGFREAFEDSADFFIVTEEEPVPEPEEVGEQVRKQVPAALILLAVVALMATRVLPVALAALFGAIAILALGCISPGDARRSIDWSVLLVIGAALGLGTAMETSGAAAVVGEGVVELGTRLGAVGVLAAIFAACMIFTNVITNNAAVALMFPIALAAAQQEGLEARPLVIGITIASSLAFMSPLGYQTNLMVYGPGGYRFSDFVRAGLPLQILVAIVAILLIPWVWPLTG